MLWTKVAQNESFSTDASPPAPGARLHGPEVSPRASLYTKCLCSWGQTLSWTSKLLLIKKFLMASDFYLNPLVKISELIPLVFTLFRLTYLWPCKLSSSRESILEWKEKPCISYMIADDKWHRNTSTFTSYLWANWYILLLSENILANMVLYMSKFQIPCFLHVQEWIKHSIILLVVLIDAFSAQGSFLITIFHWNTLMSRN